MSKIKNYGDGRILFLDISSTCTGWAVASQDVGKKEATIHKAGVIWFGADMDHGAKYYYLAQFIANIAYVQYQVDHVVAEGYMVNRKRIMGVLVIPEATGAVKASCYEVDPPLTFDNILPQTWRSALKIKKNPKFAGTKAWKEPARKFVDKQFPKKVPKKIMSNVTGKERATPHDLYDALCIAMRWFAKDPNKCTSFKLDKDAFA